MYRPRQIIAENGTPVGIYNTPENSEYASYTIGTQDLTAKAHATAMQDPDAEKRWKTEEREVTRRVVEKIKQANADPDDSSTYNYHDLREAVLSEDTELATRLEAAKSSRATLQV